MDAVTAISGSGPAYFFYFMDLLAQAGIRQGLSPEAATKLAIATCEGSAALALANQNTSLEQLRKNVTSPGGTTAAALEVFQKDDSLQKLIASAVGAAVKRAQEL